MQGPNVGTYREGRGSAARSGSEYEALRVATLLRQETDGRGGWQWAINPYQGCEWGCAVCPQRLGRTQRLSWHRFSQRVLVKVNAVGVLRRELEADDVRGHPLVFGTQADPWQPAEHKFRLTRAMLEELCSHRGLDLHLHTRSSLIARDTDLLRQLSMHHRLRVTVGVASVDDRIVRLMEPQAPSAFRRLAAMEALARAGVTVGLRVSPVMPGLDQDELGLEPLLTRASSAGAQFAELGFLTFQPGQRESFLAHVTASFPTDASRFRRVIGPRHMTAEHKQTLLTNFGGLCQRLGLSTEPPPPSAPVTALAPMQLGLFDLTAGG